MIRAFYIGHIVQAFLSVNSSDVFYPFLTILVKKVKVHVMVHLVNLTTIQSLNNATNTKCTHYGDQQRPIWRPTWWEPKLKFDAASTLIQRPVSLAHKVLNLSYKFL